jgi:ABC-type branched-subunit amino acid transport system substrate-binding protein
VAFLLKKTRSTKLGILAYHIAASSASCTTAGKLLRKAGVTVAFENLSTAYDGSYSSTVQRMKSAGVDFVLSCMQDTDNITLSRDIQEYGLKTDQLWLTAGGQALIDKYPALMTGIFMSLTSVPFGAPTKYYPGLEKYLTSMKKYAPKFALTQVAIRGWASGALLVAGIRAAGKDVTQKRVVQLTNKMTDFSATDLITPVHWNNAHTRSTGPWCTGYVQVKDKKMLPKFGKGHQVFSCFELNPAKPDPVAAPPGTPGVT